MLERGENHSIYLRNKELCDPEGYLRICFKSLPTCSAWFSSNGSSVLLHTLLHLSKVTLTLLIYFNDYILRRVLPLLITSELQTVALSPGSPCTTSSRSIHVHCDDFSVCDWNNEWWEMHQGNMNTISTGLATIFLTSTVSPLQFTVILIHLLLVCSLWGFWLRFQDKKFCREAALSFSLSHLGHKMELREKNQ